ncbi:YdeI/OmpD-associated family protein [Spirosoma horti]
MKNELTFETTLLQTGNNTGIRVPDAIIEQLGMGKRPPLEVTLNGFTYATTVGVMGGHCLIPVSAAVRAQAGVKGGDPITVQVSPRSGPSPITLSADFQQTLEANQDAKVFFDSLSPSGKKKYVSLLESAKTDETRQKRLQKIMADLVAGRK